MPPNPLCWQFSKGMVGIDCFALWWLGLQLGKRKWLRAKVHFQRWLLDSHVRMLAGTFAGCLKWSICVWSFHGAWLPHSMEAFGWLDCLQGSSEL